MTDIANYILGEHPLISAMQTIIDPDDTTALRLSGAIDEAGLADATTNRQSQDTLAALAYYASTDHHAPGVSRSIKQRFRGTHPIERYGDPEQHISHEPIQFIAQVRNIYAAQPQMGQPPFASVEVDAMAIIYHIGMITDAGRMLDTDVTEQVQDSAE
jgi:hypothetical protein